MVKIIDYNIQQAWETTCMSTMITNFPKESCYEMHVYYITILIL